MAFKRRGYKTRTKSRSSYRGKRSKSRRIKSYGGSRGGIRL